MKEGKEMKNIGIARMVLLFSVSLIAKPVNAQWTQTNGPYGGNISALAVSGTNLFAVTGGGVFLSTNNGTSWAAVNSGLYNNPVYALAVSGTNLFAGTYGGVFLSTNNGTSWTAVNSGLTDAYVFALAVSGTNLFAGTFFGNGVFLSTNNGTSWIAVNSGLNNNDVNALAVSDTNLFAGIYGSGVFLSTNNGTSWTAVDSGLTKFDVHALAVSGTNLFAGEYGPGAFLSTNNGTKWKTVNSGLTTNFSAYINALEVFDKNLFAGTTNGVYLSTNDGTSWTTVDSGLTNTDVLSFAVSPVTGGTNLFAGTYGSGVWRRQLSEMVTEVEENQTKIPNSFALEQNYPNPFNPSTNITFSVGTYSYTSLQVYDLLGREVATLVNEKKPAGTYTMRWNASGFPSGVYFYRLRIGSLTETKKLVLLR